MSDQVLTEKFSVVNLTDARFYASPFVLAGLMGNPENQICCTNSEKKTACNGDSGGPLVFVDSNNKAICLYGLTSYGPLGCNKGLSVFTRVSKYQQWITSTVAENS